MCRHCSLHCPKDCNSHRNYPHYHPDHCDKGCYTHVKRENKEVVVEEEVDVITGEDLPPIPSYYEDDVELFHDGISCDSCGKEVQGPLYHNDPNLDICQACVQKGIPGSEFCICYTVCCGYYEGIFSTRENYLGF